MTASTEKERGEVIYTDQGINVAKDGVLVALIPWEQAARRAPVVQPDHLPPGDAKRAMEELQTEVEKLRSALAECRDACPIPKPGASNEEAWMQSIGDPESVPAFVKSCLGAPAVPVPKVTDAMIEAANEAYCPFGDMQLAIQAALAAAPQPPEEAPDCLTCNDHGAVGNILNAEPCPDCTMKRVTGCSVSNGETQTAPVQLPEPWGQEFGGGIWYSLYTEQQVRELLAQQARAPLTENQWQKLWEEWFDGPGDAEDLIRSIERAHGIQEQST